MRPTDDPQEYEPMNETSSEAGDTHSVVPQSPTHRRRRILLTTLLAVAAGIWIYGRANIGDFPQDAEGDWLVASAASDGLDPYGDVRELSDAYNVDYGFWPSSFAEQPSYVPHPRTPAALLLLQPLTLVDFTQSVRVMNAVGAAVLVISIIALSLRFDSAPMLLLTLVPLIILLSRPSVTSFIFSSQSPFLFAAAVAVAISTTDRGARAAGILLGIAGALKLFPLLLVIPLLRFRRKTALYAIGTVGILFVAGSLLPGVDSVDRGIEAFRALQDIWLETGGNASASRYLTMAGLSTGLASAITVGAAIIGAVLLSFSAKTADSQWLLPVAAMCVLGSPLAWSHYGLVLLPAIALGVKASGQNFRWLLLLSLALLMPTAAPGVIDTAAWTLALVGGIVAASSSRMPTADSGATGILA